MGRQPGNGLATTAVGGIVVKTLAQVLERFRDEVSPKNKGHHWERVRIDRFLKDEPELCAKSIHTVTTVDLAAWRDKRLAQPGAAHVLPARYRPAA